VALVRGKAARKRPDFSLAQYVNDRPYAASSMLAVALGRVYRTALAGRCDARPDLPAMPIPLEIHAPAVPCRGGAAVAEEMFAPLGWRVEATPIALDPAIPAWGDSRYVDLRLIGTMRLADALSHLYVLLPVLDAANKHYWVDDDEVDKLLRVGQRWLAGHPERERIAQRYLAGKRRLAESALERLAELDDAVPAPDDEVTDVDETSGEGLAPASDAAGPADADRPATLAVRRREAVLEAIATSGARSVVDLGCGEGGLLSDLLADPRYERLLGIDVSPRSLEVAARRLHLDTLPDRKRQRIELAQSSVTYRDARVAGFAAAVLMEVVEHVDPPRLPALERAVLGAARPGTLVVTTPNAEYNALFENLAAGAHRHRDHRFEWTRAEFEEWARAAAQRYGYAVDVRPVGDEDDERGAPTQMAVFVRGERAGATTGEAA
jgi:3' terminal RNA ribose 2'-O-methyltransferase Hen1